MTARCMARQYSSQMRCERCRLTWDAGDPYPPDCLSIMTLTLAQGHSFAIGDQIEVREPLRGGFWWRLAGWLIGLGWRRHRLEMARVVSIERTVVRVVKLDTMEKEDDG